MKKKIIPCVLRNFYGSANTILYVTRVTPTTIIVACNDCTELKYDRSEGHPKPCPRFSFSITKQSLEALERWLKEYGTQNKDGVYVYDSGFRPGINTRGEIVNQRVVDAFRRTCTTKGMLYHLGYQFALMERIA